MSCTARSGPAAPPSYLDSRIPGFAIGRTLDTLDHSVAVHTHRYTALEHIGRNYFVSALVAAAGHNMLVWEVDMRRSHRKPCRYAPERASSTLRCRHDQAKALTGIGIVEPDNQDI